MEAYLDFAYALHKQVMPSKNHEHCETFPNGTHTHTSTSKSIEQVFIRIGFSNSLANKLFSYS